MKKQPKGHLAEVSGADIQVDPQAHYDSWAQNYDSDLLQEYGYTAHKLAAEALSAVVADRQSLIMDIGCGTGLVGEALVKYGYTNFDGADFSPGMLQVACNRDIYQQLIQADLTKKTDIADASYDAVVCAGVFGSGHLNPENLIELLRIVKPGCPMVIVMNEIPYINDDYNGYLNKLSDDGQWMIQRNERFNYMDELDRPGRLIVVWKNLSGS